MPRVAVIGAGWAGLACAIASASAGAQVDVFEQRESAAEAAVHVSIVPNMMRDLSVLGLAEGCVRSGFPYRGLTLADAAGHRQADIPFTHVAGAQLPAALGMKRQALTDLLIATASKCGVRIHWQEAVESIDFAGAQAVLRLASGRPVAHEVTLLAAGAGSAWQQARFAAPLDPLAAEATWWCALVPRPFHLNQPMLIPTDQHSKALLIPVSSDEAGLALVDSAPARRADDGHGWSTGRGWLAAHPACPPELAKLLDSELRLQPIPVRPFLLAGPWHRGSLMCVGDAAHVLPHHLGQSAAQAFEDAVVFGELLGRADDAASLFKAFEERRQPRVQAVLEIASRVSQWDRAPDGSTGLAELSASMAQLVTPPP